MVKAVVSFLLFSFFIFGDCIGQQMVQVASGDSLKMAQLYSESKEERLRNPELSLEYGQQFLDMALANQNLEKQAEAYENLGRIYFNIGNYGKTLEYFFKVLEIAEYEDNRLNQAITLNNIGIVYHENLQHSKALEYYNRSLGIKEELGSQKAIANTLTNVGLIHDEMGELEKAYSAYQKSLKMDLAMDDADGLFANYNNIGENMMKRKLYDSALTYFNKSWQIGMSIENDYDKSHLLNNMGKALLAKGSYIDARKKFHQSIEIAKNINARLRLKDSYFGLSNVFDASNDFAESLKYYRLYEYVKDSLFNEEKLTRINEIETDHRLKRKEAELNILRKEIEINNLKKSQTRLVAYLLISCLFLFGTLVVVLYKRNQFKIKANKDLENKNNEIVAKNSDIMDSISYAKSIQEAFLPDTAVLNKFFSDNFIYYKARDVINGDFYWFADEEDFLILAIVDCTGHGVPGALITMMGNSLLNQVVNEKRILDPAEILTELNVGVFDTLNQGNFNLKNNDGMDVAICRFDKGSKKLTFAGAKRPFYYFKNNEFHVIKGDSHSIGGVFYQKERSYKEHEVYLNQGDQFYIFTDGYVDQFGGEKNKKFLPGRFKDVLHEIQNGDMDKQRETLDRKIRVWKGENDQTDDILVMGLLI